MRLRMREAYIPIAAILASTGCAEAIEPANHDHPHVNDHGHSHGHDDEAYGVPLTPEQRAEIRSTQFIPKDDAVRVDIMLVYSTEARKGAGGYDGMATIIEDTRAWGETLSANADTGMYFNIVYSGEVALGEGHSNYVNAVRLDEEVNSLRDHYGADLVLYINESAGPCGAANLTTSGNYAYGQARRDCVPARTGWHELGHMMGLTHDNLTRSPAYARGYVVSEEFRTTMGVTHANDTDQIARWSDADGEFEGIPLGVDGEHDAARALREAAENIADYRPDGAGIPVVRLLKGTHPAFALDGNKASLAGNGTNVHLWTAKDSNDNQKWHLIFRGNGYYSFRKFNTDYCLDGGNGGGNYQNAYLWQCQSGNYNQHWKMVDHSGDQVRFEKRNASSYALDGNRGASDGQNVHLWSASSSNINQGWILEEVD